MDRRGRFGRDDALAIGVLVSTAIVIAWPILKGGHLAYMDNPVHLAEIDALATSGAGGWSELGFLGFPLGTLHSPLWYPALAALSRAGVGIERVYAALLVLGFVAPALAVYGVACRRAEPFWALVLAFVVLIQAPAIRGISSPLAGMWTHGLGAAGVVLLAGTLARPRLGLAGHCWVAVLLAATALTHLFALLAAALVVAITTAIHYWDRELSRRELGLRAFDCSAAALASSAYWLTFFLTARPELAPQQMLGPLELICHLLLPSDVLFLLERQLGNAIRRDLFLSDALPLLGLLIAGVLGIVHRAARTDALTRTGFGLAAIVFGALLVHPFYPLPGLGPVSFRHVIWVQLGAALSAIAWLASLRSHKLVGRARALLPVALVGSGLWWGTPLRNDRPAASPEEWRDLESLWHWLRDHADPRSGRVYLQDTFGQGWKGGLAHSHVLVFTHARTGLPQLGVYYGVVPYATRWTLSEFGRLYDRRELDAPALEFCLQRTSVTHLVASNDTTATFLDGSGVVDRVYAIGRYTVFRAKRPESWIDPLNEANQVRDVDFQPGTIRFELSSPQPKPRVAVKTSWHPWWTVEGVPGAVLLEAPDGLLGVDAPGPGRHRITLRYAPSPWPGRASILGWVMLVGWGIVSVYGWRR
jgi:hypothetical protein